ncbi:hypothetical protein Gotur_013378 [Gossypium turneri]
MDPEAARTARESLDLAFHMSNILDTGLDRHTLSVLIALCDLGLNPEALAAVVKELQREPPPSTPLSSSSSQHDCAQSLHLIQSYILCVINYIHSGESSFLLYLGVYEFVAGCCIWDFFEWDAIVYFH